MLSAHLPFLPPVVQAVFAELAADVYARGSTLAAHWQRLRQQYGTFEFRSGYFVATPPSKSVAVFERLRSAPPACIGGHAVRAVRDLGTGVDTSQPGELRRCKALALRLAQRGVLLARCGAAWRGLSTATFLGAWCGATAHPPLHARPWPQMVRRCCPGSQVT